MSMISELVDRLRVEAKSMGKYGTDYMATLLTRSADTIVMLSEKERADRPQEWIPCSERLPMRHNTYIVSGKMKYHFENEYEHFVDAAEYDPYDSEFNTWNDWYEGQDEFEIVAWKPLPKPWKGADDE